MLRLVLVQGLRIALVGVVVGAVGALFLTRLLASFLHNVNPTDPLTFVTVALLLMGVAIVACYVPARRAIRVVRSWRCGMSNKLLRRFLLRLVSPLTWRQDEARLREEIQEHLALQTAAHIRAGMRPDEARRQAVLKFGAVDAIKEDYRDRRSLPLLEHVIRDFRYAVRSLFNNPGFTTVAVLTLALGIGANTAVFTVADALMFRPPPFDRAEHLYWIYDTNEKLRLTVSDMVPPTPANFVDWRRFNRSFDYMVAWRNWWFSVAGPSGYGVVPEQVRGVNVSPTFFDMLGVRASLGRTFRLDEEEPGRNQVVVLTHGFWQRRFGGDPDIVGQTVRVDGQPFLIIGVSHRTSISCFLIQRCSCR